MTPCRLVAAIALTFFLAACGALQPPEPKLGPPPPNPPPMASVVGLSVRVPMPALAQNLNGAVGKQLYKGSNIDIGSGQRMKLTVTRGPITMKTANGRLTASVTLKSDIGIDGTIAGLKHHEDGEVDIKVTISTRLAVVGDYQLTSQTTGDFEVEKAYIKLGAFEIPIKDQVEKQVRPSFQAMVKEIDQRIVGFVNLKPAMGSAWGQLGEPLRISTSPETWLAVQPRTLRFAAPRSDGNDLVFGFSVECLTGVWLLRKPKPADLGPLPQLVIGGEPSGKLRLAFPFSIGHQEASKMATAALSKKPFDMAAGIKLKVTKAEVGGSGSQLVVRTAFDATAGGLGGNAGYLYFRGTPIYDAEKREMRVDDFDYDVATRDMVSKVADWLLHKEFVKAVQKELVFPFGKRMDEKKAEFSGKEVKIGNVASVVVTLDKIAPAATLEVTPNDLRAYVVVEGSAELRIGVK